MQSAERVLSERSLWQTQDLAAALAAGDQIQPIGGNGSLGSRAYSLQILAMAGLMRCETVKAGAERAVCRLYRLTDEGREELRAQQAAAA